MSTQRLQTLEQAGRTASPWSRAVRLKALLWAAVWTFLFRPSPNRGGERWRLWLLRLFGARISGRPFVACTALVRMPWNLSLEHESCLGDRAEVYNLAPVHLGRRSTVAQQVYLCCGTHDLSRPDAPLVTGEIVVGEEAFIGVRALVLPGIHIGDGAVVGAGAVVTRDMPEWTVCAGNPCRPLKPRQFEGRATTPDFKGTSASP